MLASMELAPVHLDPLAPRLLFAAAPIDTSAVALYTPDGSPAAIDGSRDVWLTIHGLSGSKDDPTTRAIAASVAVQAPSQQSLILDWSELSTNPPDNGTATRGAWAAADKIAGEIRSAGLAGSHVNLIAFSLGAQVLSRLAKDLGGVNCVIAVDAASPDVNGSRASINLAARSRYALAFHSPAFSRDAETADDNVALAGLPGGYLDRHVEAQYLFATLMRRNAGFESAPGDQVSPMFSIQNILTGNLPRWKKNAFSNNSEAVITCGTTTSSEVEPLQLTYRPLRGRPVTIA
jgi:hypothetical protein